MNIGKKKELKSHIPKLQLDEDSDDQDGSPSVEFDVDSLVLEGSSDDGSSSSSSSDDDDDISSSSSRNSDDDDDLGTSSVEEEEERHSDVEETLTNGVKKLQVGRSGVQGLRLDIPKVTFSIPTVHGVEEDDYVEQQAEEDREGEEDGEETHIALLTQAFTVKKNQGLDSMMRECADKFGVRQDRLKMYELGSSRFAVDISGSDFTLAAIEDMLAKQELMDESKALAKVNVLEERVQDLQGRLDASEGRRREALEALKELRSEFELLHRELSSQSHSATKSR